MLGKSLSCSLSSQPQPRPPSPSHAHQYLAFEGFNLCLQAADVAVHLRDLGLRAAQIIPVLPSQGLQFLILQGQEGK